MFQKIKSTALSILGLTAFESKDGKVNFSKEQQDKLTAGFGKDFVAKFTASLEKELADTSMADQNETLQALIDSMVAENTAVLARSQEAMETMLAEKLAAQAADFNTKIEALSADTETDPNAAASGAGAATDSFKLNPKHMHNIYAKAMMAGGMEADVAMAGDTVNVDDLKAEFGTYLNQKDKPILKALTQKTETMKFMTTKLAITEWRASQALITSVVQQFSSKWTPLGAGKFTPITIINRRHKINVPITPDEINDSWLSHMYDESLTPLQMPITKYIVNELILPKVEEDRELRLIANGVYTDFGSAPSTGDDGQATGLSMDGFMTILIKLYEDKENNNVNFNALGAISSANVVDQLESFVDDLDPLYKRKAMNIFCSDTFYKTYKRSYRDLFPTTKNQDNSDQIDFSLQKMQTLPSMAGYKHFFTTPKANFIRLAHKNKGASKIWMQGVDYDVKVFAEWWEAAGFAIQEALYVYIDALQIVQGYATKSSATALKTYMLTDAGCTDVQEGKLTAYKSAIAAVSSIADLAALQAIVTAANA